jgi:dolichyl-phosphate beta-glucosyltransferase
MSELLALPERRPASAFNNGEPTASRGALVRNPIDVEIVIPVFNEEHRIRASIKTLGKYLAASPFSARVVIVDNGSADRTTDLVDQLADVDVDVAVIGCSRPGKGAAVRRGVMTTRARYIGFCDADLSTPVEAIGSAVRLLADGCEMVIGSRRCPGGQYLIPQPLVRRVGSWAFRQGMRSVTNGIKDTQCGFKFFEADTAKRLFGDMQSGGFAFDIEIIARAQEAGIRLAELPVVWTDQDGSSLSPMRDGARIWKEMRALRALDIAA